jgi:uncharacterized protein YjiS (DUF1127 family)
MTHTLKAILQAIVNVFYKPVKYSQYRETYKALDRLNDRDLWDMGITRGDIDDIAAGRFRKS